MNISKNQIWVLIGIVAIGVIALVSDIEVKVEVGMEDYASKEECMLREAQQCPDSDVNDCFHFSVEYCSTLDYPYDIKNKKLED
jgi:hypothetical protein